MIENFEVFYKAFLQFSVNTARRIVKDEHIANDIAHNVFSYFFEHQDMLDFSDEEMLMAKVSRKTRKESFDYMKLSCNRHEMCIIDADNGDEIIDEKSNPETIILELEDKAEKYSALDMLRRENPLSYEILIRTRVYGETSEEVGKELGMSRNCVNNRNSRATTWMKEKIKKIRRHL